MASQNDSVLSNNSYDTNNSINCNNNESEGTSSSLTSTRTTHHGLSAGTQQKNEIQSKNLVIIDRSYSGGADVGGICSGDYKNIRATITTTAHTVEPQTRREENPFSFKHFLNRDTSSASVSTNSNNSNLLNTSCNNPNPTSTSVTVTTTATINELNSNNSNNNSGNLNETSNLMSSSRPSVISAILKSELNESSSGNIHAITTTITSPSTPTVTSPTTTLNVTSTAASSSTSTFFKTSTGARPKVPQSSVSNSNQYPNYSSYQQQQQQQQPQQQQYPLPSTSVSTTSMSSLIGGSGSAMKRSPRFSSFDSQASLAEYAGSGLNGGGGSGDFRDAIELDGSNLVDREASMTNFFSQSNRNDSGSGGNNSNLENSKQQQQQQQQQQYVHRSFSNYDMDLPPKNSNSGGVEGIVESGSGIISPRRRNSPARPNRSNSSGMQQSNSNKNYPGSSGGGQRPPNSEFSNVLPDFVQDHWMDQWYYNDMNLSSPPNSPISSPVDFVEDLPVGGGIIGNLSNATDKCQMLPDFLSDGPIIHSSSARLADVAAGLPPDLDSPEDNSPNLQLSRLRLENERLRRELDESRLALAEQTRRAGELERRLEQARSNEAAATAAAAYNRTLSQNSAKIDENLDQSKKRAAAAQSQVSKLKQQVKQLTAEVDVLRRENESLREDGAVGGGDRVTRRPSRTQQLSRDLMRAASNAENNLRQLLSGVENLRLMAATIENMDKIAIDSTNQSNPIINEEFLSDASDGDFDDFSGPAL